MIEFIRNFFNRRKKYDLREEVGKYVAKNFGEQYVDEALSNYDTINSGGAIGGLLETMAFVSMVENVKQELKDRR